MKNLRSALSLLLVFILLVSLMPAVSLAESVRLGTAVDGDVQFGFNINSNQPWLGKDCIYYSDSFFLGSAFSYNHALATASLGAAMGGTSRCDEGQSENDTVKSFLKGIGCEADSIRTVRYDEYETMDDVCAVAFGVKSIPGTDKYLVPVIIRGTRYSGEWVSNSRFYDENYPDNTSGFRRSAEYAEEHLEAYISELSDTYGIKRADLKLWISGYSRGAAIANNLGQMMTEAGGIEQENIFVYSFATPATVKKSAAGSYGNIFSICSEMDIVPRVPLEQWGYTRYGITLYLPCLSKNGSAYYDRLAAMQKEFDAIMERVSTPEMKNEPFDYQEKAIDLVTSLLAQTIASPEEYYSKGWQDILEGVMRDHSNQNQNGETLASILLEALLPGGDLVRYLLDFFENCSERTPNENICALNKLLLKIDITKAAVITQRDTKLLGALYDLFTDYRISLEYERLIGRNSGSTTYYHTLIAELASLALRDDNPLMVQHWAESYLAWMRSGTAEELFTTVPHDSSDVRRPVLTGDLNGDGSVNSKDSKLLSTYLIAPRLVSIDMTAADIDGNGKINISDLTKLNKLLSIERSGQLHGSYINKLCDMLNIR